MRLDIEGYCQSLSGVLHAMPFGTISRVANLLLDCYRRGGTVYLLGNGGSAATASHFACDLAKGARIEGLEPFRVVPLTDNVPLLSAWANDVSYESIFAEQLAGLLRPGDLVVAISASGNSPNVLAAARAARHAGVKVIAFSGRTGGSLLRLANVTVRVPSDSIEQVEDAHLILAHGLCVVLRQRLQAEVGLQPTKPLAFPEPATEAEEHPGRRQVKAM